VPFITQNQNPFVIEEEKEEEIVKIHNESPSANKAKMIRS
jgi:hypothetical protein